MSNYRAFRNRFVILCTIAIIAATSANAQLPDSTLKEICISQFREHVLPQRTDAYPYRYSATEQYEGVFRTTKLITVTVGNCDDCPVANYAVDVHTGKGPTLTNVEQYNKELDSNRKDITTYDKAAFYLIVNGMARFVTPSAAYYGYVVVGAVFGGMPDAGLNTGGMTAGEWKKYSSFIDRSARKMIYMGAIRYDANATRIITIYRFNFNKDEQLTTVETLFREPYKNIPSD